MVMYIFLIGISYIPKVKNIYIYIYRAILLNNFLKKVIYTKIFYKKETFTSISFFLF